MKYCNNQKDILESLAAQLVARLSFINRRNRPKRVFLSQEMHVLDYKVLCDKLLHILRGLT
jgi:hypothetical protein